ncbi:unnamed protein product, partial [Ectocarpus sp. 12 AP-2014]
PRPYPPRRPGPRCAGGSSPPQSARRASSLSGPPTRRDPPPRALSTAATPPTALAVRDKPSRSSGRSPGWLAVRRPAPAKSRTTKEASLRRPSRRPRRSRQPPPALACFLSSLLWRLVVACVLLDGLGSRAS